LNDLDVSNRQECLFQVCNEGTKVVNWQNG